MWDKSHWTFLLILCLLSGCQTLATTSGSSLLSSIWGNLDSRRDAFPISLENDETAYEQGLIGMEIEEARRGSLVCVSRLDGRPFATIVGTLLSKNRDGIRLMNCYCTEPVPGPDKRDQCQTSHIPFQTVPLVRIGYFSVVSPPSSKTPRSERDIDPNEVRVREVVYRNGDHICCAELMDPINSQSSIMPPDELTAIITTAQDGSLVSITDISNRQFIGRLQNVSSTTVNLMNCVWHEEAPDTDDRTQIRTINVPFQSFATSALKSFKILASPYQRDNASDQCDDCDCYQYIVDKFMLQAGRECTKYPKSREK